MRNPKILGLNTNFEPLHFPNFQENVFSSIISLLDYDAIIIDSSRIINEYVFPERQQCYRNKISVSDPESSQIMEDFSKVKEQLTELLKHGRNVFVLVGYNPDCYLSNEGSFFASLDNFVEFDMYSFLPISLKVTHLQGRELSFCGNQLFSSFFDTNKDNLEYNAYFESQKENIPLARIRGMNKIVSFYRQYEQGFLVFLPAMSTDRMKIGDQRWKYIAEQYLKSIYSLNNDLCSSQESNELPSWTEHFHILNELEAIQLKHQSEAEMQKLQKKIEAEQKAIDTITNYKRLLTETGAPLENIVKQVLSELGFELCPTEEKRSDVIAKYANIDIVAEIKGVGKSAAEKHAAQLEKWASQFLIDHGHQPRALLIVNGYNMLPLNQRTEEVFPDQMLKYSTSREQALITTTQLLCLFIEIQENPECKEERIQELLSTIGRYNRYTDYSEFITQ